MTKMISRERKGVYILSVLLNLIRRDRPVIGRGVVCSGSTVFSPGRLRCLPGRELRDKRYVPINSK